MATEGGGKIKPKRSHSTSKPYERRKSLLGKVTDTVKDLLAPSWLTDFVSTVSKKTPPKDKKDAFIEEEEDVFMELRKHFEGFWQLALLSQPSQLNNVRKPPRMQQQQERDKRNAVPAPRSATATAATHLDPAVPSTSLAPPQPSFSSSHLPFSKFTQQKSRIPNDDTMSERSDVSRSTSGCSSMIPHPDKQAYQREILQLNDSALDMLKTDFQTAEVFQPPRGGQAAQKDMPAQRSQPIAPKMFETFVNPPKTWTAEASSSRQGRPLAPAVREKPGFNTSLFGSPVLNQSSSILGESFGESSFYSGKTTYGGASAYRKLNSTAPYQTALPIRKQLKPKPLNNSFNAVTSSTARRILETLERMSTPLSDAKKIPASESFLTDSVLSFTPGSYRRRSLRPLTGVGATRRSLDVPKGPPTSQLKTPSIASISKNRQKLLSSTPTSSRIPEPKIKNQDSGEEDEDSSHEDEPVVIDDWPGGGGGKGGKMMREKSYRSSARRKPGEDEEEEVEPPPLKTDFTLPVMSMPAFNFKPTPGLAKKDKTVSRPVEGDKAANLKFTFSTPIQKSGPSGSTTSERAEGFKFSSPLKVTDKESLPKSSTFTAIGGSQPAFKPLLNSSVTAPVCKLGNGGIGMNMKPPVSSGQAFKPAEVLKKGSVMDVLGGGAFKPSSDLKQGSVMDVLGKDGPKSTGVASQLKSGSVMDILGKTSNDTSSSPSGFKPALQLKEGSVMDILGKGKDKTPVSSNPMTKFCKKPGEWDCDTCLVQNKSEATKCVACGTSKPGSGPKPPSIRKGSLSSGQPSLSSMFKPSAGSWDCGTCMIQNKPEDTKCVACSTPKPGAAATGTGSLSSGQPSLASMFKSSAGSWDCGTCMIQNKPEDTKCVACKTPKPGASTTGKETGSLSSGQPSLASMFKSSAGSWDCDTCMIQNKPEDTKCVACSTPKPGAAATGTPETKTSSTISASGFQISGTLFGSGTASSGGGFGGFGKSASSIGGFSMGSTDSKNAGSEGGFKIGSGFSFGSTKGSDLKSPSSDSGAKDGGSSNKGDSNNVSNVLSSQKTSSISGGFQFGTVIKNPVQELEGIVNSSFKSSTETQVSESKSSGFGFGVSASEASKTSASSEPSGTDSSNGKLAFGQKSDSTAEKKNDNIFGSVNSLSGGTGFSFGQSGATSVASSPGGFSFGATAAATTATSNTTSKGIASSGFSFGQDKTDSKPVFGTTQSAATEGSKSAAAATTNSSLFTFGQPVAGGNTDNNKPLGVGGGFPFTANTDTSTAAAAAAPKRGRDEETGAPVAKKSFSFGQSTNSTSTGGFSFGASASATTASGVFTFGASSTSSASTAAGTGTTTSTPSFSFGAAQPAPPANTPFQFSAQTASSGTNSVFQFGSNSAGPQTGFSFGSSTPVTTAAPFGTTNTLPQPAFGNTANSTPQTGAQGGGMFSNSTSVFGANNSATPVPAFGAADQNANSGGFSFKMAGTNNQSSSTLNSQPSFNFGGGGSGGVFQFTAKGNETSAGAPAQGSTSSGFSFGGTQQPQPAAPAPTFNSTNTMSFTGGNTPSFTIGSTPEPGEKNQTCSKENPEIERILLYSLTLGVSSSHPDEELGG
ncbi:LOW QUALITY PROTEIN: nuclear pore complex protein Nup153-like [Haliotis rubra]|uniref:LOW QUALITY PROTEIN: nuclear pore complex protein Nup153-like n=1 Tax=Haliotis rubra TaxID=36100 RepID=UPI001EE632B0|nr:LOW QUALITY PROTEIN: nuclear pore complex protein Nup153-like [Haliotis rubra]